jgi:cellulose synthase (UDP-forming)
MLQDYYSKASAVKKLIIKFGILYAVLLTSVYVIFRAYYINFTPILAPFSVLLYIAELHTIVLLYGLFYSLWPRNYKIYKKTNTNKDLQINMFITVAGEPIEVVRETILHAKKAADYYFKKVKPKKPPRVIVLNDGRGAKKEGWEVIRDACKELGVYHLARKTNEGFKAGNINNGIKKYKSKDPHNTIDCFFDSDFCAKKNFLMEILKPIADDGVDFVQSPQRYKNLDTWVAQAAGAHQIFFFDFICPAKAYDNALFLCGTNYAIRRQAFLDTGGVENRFVTEDYATSIKLHLIGKRGVFISKVLAKGMSPMNLKEYFNQQTRWCKGCLDANGAYLKELLFGPLTIRQKLHYFISSVYYLIGVRDLILVLAPIPFLFFGISLIRANTLQYLAFIYLPLMITNFLIFFLTFRNPVKSLVLDLVSFPVFAAAFISSVIKRKLPFTITIKKYERENPFRVYRTQLFVATVLITGLIYSIYYRPSVNPYGRIINHFWASYSATFLTLGFFLVARENYNLRFIENRITEALNAIRYGFSFGIRVAFNPAVFGMLVLITTIFVGFNLQNGNIATKAEETAIFAPFTVNKKTELLVPSNGAYYGYYSPEFNKQQAGTALGILENEFPSLVMYYQDWNENAKFNTKFMNYISSKGAVPVVTWEPVDLQTNDNSPLNTPGGNARTVVLSGGYEMHIRSWAKAAAKYKKPLFLRFAHEMNGNWYPWGDVHAFSDKEYIEMWKYVWHIFEEEGADNVIWVWSPNNTNHFGEKDNVLDFYPGDKYVDWVAFSAFNWGESNARTNWRSFKYVSWDIYTIISKLNKPIMVAETSSVSLGGNKAEWFRKTLLEDIPSMPQIKAVILFNENFGKSDFSLDSGMNAKKAVQENLFSNSYYFLSPMLVER